MILITKGRQTMKEALLEELAKEDLQVLALAHIYAKNMYKYGVDVTKAISTATEAAAIMDKVYQNGYYDAMNKMSAENEE